MISLKRNQQGFSAIETGLVVVIIAIIGFVGWYVYHARHNSNKALDAASSTSQNAGPNYGRGENGSGDTSNSSLQKDLDDANSSAGQASQSLSATNSSLGDESTFTSIPQ